MFDYKQKHNALYEHYCQPRYAKFCVIPLQTFPNSNETTKPMHKKHPTQSGFSLRIHFAYVLSSLLHIKCKVSKFQ